MPRPNLSSPLSRLKGKLRLALIASILIIAFIPIPHQYKSEEELVKTLEIHTYLPDGDSLSEIWNLRGVNIVRVNISCTTDILVHLIDKKALKSGEYKGLLAKVGKVHEYEYRVNTTSVMEVKVSNPAWIEDGPVLHPLRGSIEAYRVTRSVWLPWWWSF